MPFAMTVEGSDTLVMALYVWGDPFETLAAGFDIKSSLIVAVKSVENESMTRKYGVSKGDWLTSPLYIKTAEIAWQVHDDTVVPYMLCFWAEGVNDWVLRFNGGIFFLRCTLNFLSGRPIWAESSILLYPKETVAISENERSHNCDWFLPKEEHRSSLWGHKRIGEWQGPNVWPKTVWLTGIGRRRKSPIYVAIAGTSYLCAISNNFSTLSTVIKRMLEREEPSLTVRWKRNDRKSFKTSRSDISTTAAFKNPD